MKVGGPSVIKHGLVRKADGINNRMIFEPPRPLVLSAGGCCLGENMRYLLILVILVFVPYVAHGATKYDTAEQQDLVSSVQSDAGLINSRDVEKIREFIKNEDADFIDGISGLSDEDQVPLMRSWLARKTFNFYYDKYISEIRSQSEKTGRTLKVKTYGSTDGFIEKYYWLDRGKLDEKECQQDLIERRACDYPDGFKEYQIAHSRTVSRDKTFVNEEIIIDKDDIDANSRKVIHISLTAVNTNVGTNSSDFKNYSFSLSAGAHTEKYDEHHKWRNQEAADIRAGKFRKPTKEEQSEWKSKYKGSPFGDKLSVVVDDSRDWDSNVFPGAAITNVTIDYDFGYRHDE